MCFVKFLTLCEHFRRVGHNVHVIHSLSEVGMNNLLRGAALAIVSNNPRPEGVALGSPPEGGGHVGKAPLGPLL